MRLSDESRAQASPRGAAEDTCVTLLREIVDGKSVAVVANNPQFRGFRPAEDVTLRFNHDPSPADVWCYAFFGDHSAGLHDSCSMVLGTVPDQSVDLRGFVRDYRPDIADKMSQIQRPVGFVGFETWRELFLATGGVPLSGVVTLELLSQTKMISCAMYGFNFHIGRENRSVRNGGQIGSVHDAQQNIRFLQDLLRRDRRFRAGEGTRLYWPMLVWTAYQFADSPVAAVRNALGLSRRKMGQIMRTALQRDHGRRR
jgi:hypothetical protein